MVKRSGDHQNVRQEKAFHVTIDYLVGDVTSILYLSLPRCALSVMNRWQYVSKNFYNTDGFISWIGENVSYSTSAKRYSFLLWKNYEWKSNK